MRLLIITQKVDKNDSVLGFFHRWIIEFAKHAEFLTVICLYKGEYDLPQNVKVLSLGKEEGKSRLEYLMRFYRYIWSERKNYDSVFVHMNQIYVLLGGPVWRTLGKKVGLWYAHGHVSFSLRMATWFSNIIFTSTESGFRINTPKKKIVGQGIDINLFSPADISANPVETFRIITIGRISPVKNYEIIIDSIEALRDVSNIEVMIVGGPTNEEQMVYVNKLRTLVQEKGLQNKVKFLGSKTQQQVSELLKKSHLLINTSNTGSLDKAILEGMSSGLNVISSNDAINELQLRDIYIEPNNVGLLTHKIKLIFENGERFNKDNREYVKENHSVESLVKKILVIYKQNV